jgi:hypothetical protein
MIIKLHGGLGNQLWQYAYGRARGFAFNRTGLPDGHTHYPATYGLSEFSIDPPFSNEQAEFGYYQDERLFLDIKDEIRKEFSIGIVVQVRRYQGDEIVFHGNLPASYYKDAVAQLPNRPVRVITDNPSWVEENLNWPIINTGHRNTDIWLMAAAEHIVISNSSFGWWGAWLGEREGREVIVPKEWYQAPHIKHEHPCPARWTRI